MTPGAFAPTLGNVSGVDHPSQALAVHGGVVISRVQCLGERSNGIARYICLRLVYKPPVAASVIPTVTFTLYRLGDCTVLFPRLQEYENIKIQCLDLRILNIMLSEESIAG